VSLCFPPKVIPSGLAAWIAPRIVLTRRPNARILRLANARTEASSVLAVGASTLLAQRQRDKDK